MCLITAGFGISGWGFLRSPPPFTFKDIPPTRIVSDKVFVNEVVEADDTDYEHCLFRHVTFVYNGRRPFRLEECNFDSVAFKTDNPSIYAALLFLKGIGFIPSNVPFLNNPSLHINPPTPIPRSPNHTQSY